MKGELVLVDDIFNKEDEFDIGISTKDFCLHIYIDDEHPLEKQLKNRKSFDYCMNAQVKSVENDEKMCNAKKQETKYVSERFDNLLDNVEFIKLSFEKYNNIEFIKNNPIVLTKKVVLDKRLKITDYDKLMELMNEYKEIVDKVYVSLDGNSNYVNLSDCYKTMRAVKNQIDEIKKLKLSPMEAIMYVYDQVRSRVYTSEAEDESCFKSRDLSEVMFGDKIVCVGYANIFSEFLHYIGIDNLVVELDYKNNSVGGHVRNVIYVQDEKYDIDGVYYFDPTWDSKNENETNEYLYKYTYFAKTRSFMDNDEFKDFFCPVYSLDMDKKIEKIIKEGNYEKLDPYCKSLNYMSKLVTNNQLIDRLDILPISPTYGDFDKEQFLNKFREIFSKFNKEIPAEVMLKVFNNVRKVEYYQNPELYPYSINDMYKTCKMSDWKFKGKYLDFETRLLHSIFGKNIDVSDKEKFQKYGNESGIFQDYERVRLVKTLKLVCDKNKNNKNK